MRNPRSKTLLAAEILWTSSPATTSVPHRNVLLALRPANDLALLAGVSLAVMAVLNLHSSAPDISWALWLKLTTIFVPLLLFSSPALQEAARHPRLFPILALAITTGALALGIELKSNGVMLHLLKGDGAFLAEYNRGISHVVMLAFPVMAWLWRSEKKWLIVPFLLILLFPTGLTESRSAKLALLLGVVVTLAAHKLPKLTRGALAGGTVLLLGWPFAAQRIFLDHVNWIERLPASWRARMEIWDYLSYHIQERPLLGWGLGTSHTLPFQQPHGLMYAFTLVPAAHPHNVVTELWVELGIPGLLLGLSFAYLTWKRATDPFAQGAWVAGLCLALVAFNFWTDSLFAAFALTGFAFALLAQPRPR